jgi:hypothetical protein
MRKNKYTRNEVIANLGVSANLIQSHINEIVSKLNVPGIPVAEYEKLTREKHLLEYRQHVVNKKLKNKQSGIPLYGVVDCSYSLTIYSLK